MTGLVGSAVPAAVTGAVPGAKLGSVVGEWHAAGCSLMYAAQTGSEFFMYRISFAVSKI